MIQAQRPTWSWCLHPVALSWPPPQPAVRGLCDCPSPTGSSVPLFSTQTVATLSVLGTRRVVSILGVENQAVSLAACHLLQVMFDALKEGVKKGFRGKEGAIIVGEWKQSVVLWVCCPGGAGPEPGPSGPYWQLQLIQEYDPVIVILL